jgi:endonuclease YncB( thermonuclease family)
MTLTTLVCFGTTTKVTRIIDGDTFETETGEKVRLIGINAPEISDIFGQEAKQHLANLIDQKQLTCNPTTFQTTGTNTHDCCVLLFMTVQTLISKCF